jgi:hypothetical protein
VPLLLSLLSLFPPPPIATACATRPAVRRSPAVAAASPAPAPSTAITVRTTVTGVTTAAPAPLETTLIPPWPLTGA